MWAKAREDLRTASRSLAYRLTISAVAWSVIALGIAGFVLSELYRNSVERNFDTRLEVSLNTLVGFVATGPADIENTAALNEPGFASPLSGWYWIVRETQSGDLVGASRSLIGEVLDEPDPPADGSVVATAMAGPDGDRLRALSQQATIENEGVYTVTVTGNAGVLEGDIAAFRIGTFVTLAVFAVGLLGATVLQIRWGLRPLGALRGSLAAIRDGSASRLEGQFPIELEPLAAELNALIEANQAVVERARTHVGNLAHALKTPLSVITNEAAGVAGPLGATVRDQTTIMRRQVDHYLERARMAAQRRVVVGAVEAVPIVEGLARVLRRAHAERDVTIRVESRGDPRIRIEKGDLEEIVGNVMDNACKWARLEVRVTLAGAGARDARPLATIRVTDDGPGVPEEKRGEMVKRGRRLDESVPGTGLGLAIVDELVSAYGGRLAFATSEEGGLAVTVELPQALGGG